MDMWRNVLTVLKGCMRGMESGEILEFCDKKMLYVTNMWFQKEEREKQSMKQVDVKQKLI